MSAILKQRNLVVKQMFEITDKSLRVTIKKPLNYFEGEFKFWELSTRVVRVKKYDISTLICSVGALLVDIFLLCLYLSGDKEISGYAILICFGVFLVFAFLTTVLYENSVNLYLQNGRAISFLGSSPNKSDVDSFLALLREKQKAFLLNRYAKADPYLSIEQISDNLNWLLNATIITTEELNELRHVLLPKPASGAGMGFKPGQR